MAKSETITKNGSNGHHKFTLTVTETATSVANNTSTISIVFKISPITKGYNWEDYNNNPPKGTVKVNGTSYSWTLPDYNGSSTVTLVSKTQTVTHLSDGSKSISLEFSCSSLDVSYLPGSASASGTLALTPIARESTLTVSSPRTLGSNVTLTVTRHSNKFTHTITTKCDSSSSISIVTKSTNLTPTFTLPIDWASQNTTGTTVSITFSITTYNESGTKVGSTKSVTVSASMPTSVKPTVSSVAIAAGDTASTNHLQKYGGYVQGKSTVKMTATASQSYSSALKTYTFVCSGKTYTATVNNATTTVLSSTGSITANAKVTDARGRTSDEKTSTAFTVYPYTAPSVTMSVHRCSDSTGKTESMTGSYCRVDWTGTISSLNSKNAGTVTIRYKKSSAETYTEVTGRPISSGTDNAYVFPADDSSTYNVVVILQDDFTTVSTTTNLSTASVPMHFKANGRGLAIGKIAQDEIDGLDIGWNTYIKDVDMTLSDNEYDEVKPSGSTTPKRLHTILKGIVDKLVRKTPASGGTVLSMVNTGDMYTWNNKASTSVASTSANGLMSSADKTKLNAVGTIFPNEADYKSFANKTVTSTETTQYWDKFTLPSTGVWIIDIFVDFPANTTGHRYLAVLDSAKNGASANAIQQTDSQDAPADARGRLRVIFIYKATTTAERTIPIGVAQTSGSSLTARCRYRAVKISN